jgi:hypothetical protein
MKRQPIPFWKAAATTGGATLTGTAVWLNAEHVAAGEGWFSPLVFAGIFVTLCAAATPPLAERAVKTGQPAKALVLWLFFALAVSFSLVASITRSSSYRDAQVAETERDNITARLATDAYAIAVADRSIECASGRGPKCREADTQLSQARSALTGATPIRAADPAAERLATMLGISQAAVTLYSPLALPLGLELGGFIFLAIGLSPRATEPAANLSHPRKKARSKHRRAPSRPAVTKDL